ncbi:kinase-like domain-containing protein [Rhizophagus diaphanus]|nr:kinase-like domain-containing protein [Rhizophagus diaphanus] [Rhizophagus sp. MUCL 43196]
MEKSTDIRHKIDFLLLNDTQLTQNKYEKKKCSECNKARTLSRINHQICHICYIAKRRIIQSGNKVIDDFIRYTQTNYVKDNGKMIFVPYEKFENIELIGEGGFSKIYKATWIDCKISDKGTLDYFLHNESKTVALKKLKNSKNITSKELNELRMFYHYSLNGNNLIYDSYSGLVNVYYGITQDPITQDFIFIMPYYNSDLTHYITKNFYNISWYDKIRTLHDIIKGLNKIHDVNIIHRDLHSGNILLNGHRAKICDLGTCKSAIELTDNEEEIYGIIPYVAPEVLQGKKYTKASDIYSFGMIMWELMVGRRPFWDRNHNTELIIEICDGLRPPIITNAPKGYIDLMKECWHSDPKKRPTAVEILKKTEEILVNEQENKTEIIESSDIGPVTTNNLEAIYKSRYLSVKRKFNNNQLDNSFDNDYVTKELEFDIDTNSNQSNDDEYITIEINFDI